MKIALKREGSRIYTKTSYPVRYGLYSEIEYGDFRYQFNLNGEVKHIAGTAPDWPHPAEWLKRTTGNDWVYYSTGNYYSGVADLFGEYYFPYPAYPTNSLFRENPFGRKSVARALREAEGIAAQVLKQCKKYPGDEYQEMRDFLARVGSSSPGHLRKRADRFHRILQAQVSVLPPDCRHVDYDVIPVMISDGCLFNCTFCEVKSGIDFSCRPGHEITRQLQDLREFYGDDLCNYNSIYLGQHDGLAADKDDILSAAKQAYDILEIGHSVMQGPRLFLFGSTESFLQKDEDFWRQLNRLPFYVYINLGLESFDNNTLELLKKPVGSQVVEQAFQQMLAINKSYSNIEITANILLGTELPGSHISSLLEHIGPALGRHKGKGCIYMSPLKGSTDSKGILDLFREVKHQCRLDTFLYLIQRL